MTQTGAPPHPAPRRADEQRQLRAALSPRVAGPHLAAAVEGPPGPRICRVLDARYDPGISCSVLYALGERIVLGELRWDRAGAPARGGRWIEALGMSVHPFPDDPALPGLAACFEPGRLGLALRGALAERAGDADVVRCRVVPVRYRPGRRCTLRLDLTVRRGRSGRAAGRRFYAKLYHDAAKAAAVFSEMRALGADPGLRAAGTSVAEAVALVPELAMVVQEPLPGTPLDALLRPSRAAGPALTGGVERAARALASLHSGGATSARRRPPEEALEKLDARARRIGEVAPSLGAEMAAAVRALAAGVPRDGSPHVLVHGDCKPSQFLLAPGGTGILDFDHCAMADPASDVGTFVASLRQADVRRSLRSAPRPPTPLRPLEGRFLRAYLDAAPSSDAVLERAGWYVAAALLRKAQRSFARSLVSPLPGALTRQALGCLASPSAAHS
ncbi:MAG TPA: aminoglycoside phosphotransferase family protein [Actinomycetota bacterium]|nr:aminoglycoside phosphotransferase family protein [Actinomycetota bacterium]